MDWLAQLVTHIPNKGEQIVRYYGFYSNKSRGLRKKAGTDDQVPALIESDISPQAFRENWARLIQQMYHVDLLLFPKCLGFIKKNSLIENEQLVKKSSSTWTYVMSNANRLRAPNPKKYGLAIDIHKTSNFRLLLPIHNNMAARKV